MKASKVIAIQNATYPNMSPSWSTRFPYGSLYDPEVK